MNVSLPIQKGSTGNDFSSAATNVPVAINAQSPAGQAAAEKPPAQVKEPSAAKPPSKTKPAGADDSRRVLDYTFDDLKFQIEKEEPFERSKLTEKINNTDGRRIRIRGYMLPTAFEKGLTTFVLVRDNRECCFGPGAALFDCIVIEMTGDKKVDYSALPVTVEGRFTIDEFIGPERRHLSVFRIDADKVE